MSTQQQSNSNLWVTYGVEFVSVFMAVILAFALSNWNEGRKSRTAENKILTEIYYGLEKDLEDVNINKYGHEMGMKAADYFKRLVNGQAVERDSFMRKYIELTRDFISIQNKTGYEALKSRGLELIQNDTLRKKVTSLYEYDYNVLQKWEEEYQEAQFQENYFHKINAILAPYLLFDKEGNLMGVRSPIQLSERDRNAILSYLFKIEINRRHILSYYPNVQENIKKLREAIEEYLELVPEKETEN
jgi:hypothetical protein